MTDYWTEHAEIALEEAGITGATPEQINAIAAVIESAHEFYRQAHGHDVASANFAAEQLRELKRAEDALAAEKAKVICKTCNGRGRIITRGPYHSSDSECHVCRGEGRHD